MKQTYQVEIDDILGIVSVSINDFKISKLGILKLKETDYFRFQEDRFYYDIVIVDSIRIIPKRDEEIDGVGDKIEIICFAIIIDDNEALILNCSKLYYEFNELLALGEPYDIGLKLRFAYLNKGEQINYNLKVN